MKQSLWLQNLALLKSCSQKYLTVIDKEISKPFCNNNPRPPGTFSNVQTNAKNFTRGVSERRPAAPRHALPFPTMCVLPDTLAAQACEKSAITAVCVTGKKKKQNGISEIVQRNRGWEPGSDGLFLFQGKGKEKRERESKANTQCNEAAPASSRGNILLELWKKNSVFKCKLFLCKTAHTAAPFAFFRNKYTQIRPTESLGNSARECAYGCVRRLWYSSWNSLRLRQRYPNRATEPALAATGTTHLLQSIRTKSDLGKCSQRVWVGDSPGSRMIHIQLVVVCVRELQVSCGSGFG